jgi:flavin reductase (DIM6/NTAB) family NADH-FMN oxidoreductase RutF
MPDNDFENIKILDNFYQTSSFFPMPVVLVGTVSESGQTNLGPYSLCFPFRIAGKGRYAMKLNARMDSNTAMNIKRTGVCSINFIPDDKKYMKNCVLLGFPGDTTEEKMAKSMFTLLPSTRTEEEREDGIQYPEIVNEAIQVFECSLDPEMPMWIDEETTECHMILRVDKIVMKKKWKKALFEGKGFPPLPIDYGFRNNVNFWLTKHSKPYSIGLPESKGVELSSVRYAADRCDPDIKWTDEACAKIVKVPRIFLGRVVQQITESAKEEGLTEVTPEFMDRIRDKRAAEKE